MQDKLKMLAKSYSVLIQDWLRYEIGLNRLGYLRIRNRLEKLGLGPRSDSYVCLWPYTSRLKAVEVWPFVGKLLLMRVIRDNIFSYQEKIDSQNSIDISVIIGHRGEERLDLLISTLHSLGAQKQVGLECIVIEQDSKPTITRHLPSWVNYVFQEVREGCEYNRASAFNLGAKLAKGNILLLHDNDMVIAVDYCKEIVGLVREGYEALNIKRYVFYLNQQDSQRVIRSTKELKNSTPIYIVQNLEAGGSMAITKEAYFKIGGMDEDFIGWGGEDNEFWQRCSTLKRWIWGFSPVIHLWHKSQPLKDCKENRNITRARMLEDISIDTRIRRLRIKNKMND
jgi:predicted glycosyltransferase involved in capsule biosynthesis